MGNIAPQERKNITNQGKKGLQTIDRDGILPVCEE